MNKNTDFNYEQKYLKYKLKYLNELDREVNKYVKNKLDDITKNILLKKKESNEKKTNFKQIFSTTINDELKTIDCKRIYKGYKHTKRILNVAIQLIDMNIKSNPDNEQNIYMKEFIGLQSVILDLIKKRCK
jgi:hypothetical protein